MAQPQHRTHARGGAPGEVTVPGSKKYGEFNRLTDLREPYRISATILNGTKPDLTGSTLEPQPILVFINARSGGNQGTAVASELYKALGDTQVFDLSTFKPDQVLKTLWANLKQLHNAGDAEASAVLSKLRILAAGGDGTIAWIVKTIHDLKLDPAPAVAVMPLGTGNDLSRQLNWGPAFDTAWISGHKGVRATLARIALAQEQPLDTWSLKISIPFKELYSKKHPYSLSTRNTGEGVTLSGVFFNYLSVGLDAKSALGFHNVREHTPYLAANRIANQCWYAACSCKAGWFGCSRPLRTKCALHVQRHPGAEWEPLPLDDSVRAVVLLNLQSYGGGANLWGKGLSAAEREKGWHEPWICDGMLEVVAFTDGYKTGMIMGSKGKMAHARRVAQVCGVRLVLKSSVPHPAGQYSHAYIQVDGEPWTQAIPASEKDQPVQVEVSWFGTSRMLYNGTLSSTQEQQQREGLAFVQQHMQPAGHLAQHHVEAKSHAGAAELQEGSMEEERVRAVPALGTQTSLSVESFPVSIP